MTDSNNPVNSDTKIERTLSLTSSILTSPSETSSPISNKKALPEYHNIFERDIKSPLNSFCVPEVLQEPRHNIVLTVDKSQSFKSSCSSDTKKDIKSRIEGNTACRCVLF